MPTQLDIKRRIRSVKNTQQITRAMKFVAAARLRRAQEKAVSARPYARALSRLIYSAALRTPEAVHPLLRRRPEERVLLLAVSGERGLCGAFNANVIRRAIEFLREREAQKVEVMSLGRKVRDAMRKQRWEIVAEYVDITTRAEPSRAAEIAHKLTALYDAEEVDAVYVVFNEFKSVLAQNLTLQKLLPFEPDPALAGEGADLAEGGSPIGYLCEQPAAELFARLLPKYVEVQVFRALAESAASEHAARMTAMDSATNNAGELIDKLTLYMNKVRQAAITKEIIEVVSGAGGGGGGGKNPKKKRKRKKEAKNSVSFT
jgi:F-type H+-transporting ATPase subunit gamma